LFITKYLVKTKTKDLVHKKYFLKTCLGVGLMIANSLFFGLF